MSLKMNIYRHAFSAKCPSDGEIIAYRLEIKTPVMLLVERLKAFTADIHSGYHEQLADELHMEFGGEQRMVAFHQDVEIETVRLSE